MENIHIIFEVHADMLTTTKELREKLNAQLKDITIVPYPTVTHTENYGILHSFARQLSLSLEVDMNHLKQVVKVYNQLRQITSQFIYVTCQNHHGYNDTMRIYSQSGLEWSIQRVKDKTLEVS